MKNTRKLTALLLAALLLFSLTACGGRTTKDDTDTPSVSSGQKEDESDTTSEQQSGSEAQGEVTETPDTDTEPSEEETPDTDTEPSEEETPDTDTEPSEEETPDTDTEPSDTETPDTEEPDSEELVDGMRPAFKEAMDSYEAFYTEYCEFMKKYNENSSDLSLLADYAQLLVKAAEADAAFAEWDEDDLNSAELAYYLEVNSRVLQMLAEVAN